MFPFSTLASKVEKLFRTSRASREVTVTTLQGAATGAEASGTEGTRQHWAPASRNTAELVKKFDEVLLALGNDDSFPMDQTIYNRLVEQQSRFTQYALPTDRPNYECSKRTRELIFLSAYASKAAYGKTSAGDASYLKQLFMTTVSEVGFQPSLDGSVKQIAVRLLVPQIQDKHVDSGESTLIVAIKGTVSFADWMVNFNGDPVETQFLTLTHREPQGSSPDRSHSGLLRVAEKMEPEVTKLIRNHLDINDSTSPKSQLHSPPNIILTGHSAGGGVAALLFIHYLAKKIFAGAQLSCVTFAAPPVTQNVKIEENLLKSSEFISVINEGDPVPRADKPYILAFADLYGDAEKEEDAPLGWVLPIAELHIPEQSTILALRIREETESDLKVEVNQVSVEEVEQTLALDFERHRMDLYIKELESWAQNS